jgi:hypothetical protein
MYAYMSMSAFIIYNYYVHVCVYLLRYTQLTKPSTTYYPRLKNGFEPGGGGDGGGPIGTKISPVDEADIGGGGGGRTDGDDKYTGGGLLRL